MPAVAPVDSAGAAITVGAAVKLLGTVTAINMFEGHYAEVTVLLTNPISVPDVVVAAGATENCPGWSCQVHTVLLQQCLLLEFEEVI